MFHKIKTTSWPLNCIILKKNIFHLLKKRVLKKKSTGFKKLIFIKQPTLEQYDAILSDDRELYEEFIKIINMYAGISGISEKLFFKDLHVLDIASPSNCFFSFILYFCKKKKSRTF